MIESEWLVRTSPEIPQFIQWMSFMTSANDMIQTEMLQTIYNLIHAYDRNDGQ